MYIKSIALKNFKKFADFRADFSSDITVVKGPNEKGKSTLFSAFLAGLFYDPKKSNKNISILQSWQSDILYEITIEIEHKGEELILHKNFQTKELFLKNKTTGKNISSFSEILDVLYTISALRSPALFEHTAYVSHDAFEHVGEGKQAITNALEELLTSSEKNVSADKVMKKVSDAILRLQKGMQSVSKRPGILKQIEIDLEKMHSKQENIKEDLQKTAESYGILSDYKKKHNNITHELEIKQSQYQKNMDYFKIIQELKSLHSQFDTLSSDIITLEEIEKKKEYALFNLNKIKNITSVDMESVARIQQKLALKKEQLVHFAKDKDVLEASNMSQKTEMKKPYFFVTAAFFLFGFLGFLDPRIFISWGLCALVFVYSYIFRKGLTVHTRTLVKAEYDSLRHEIAILQKQLHGIFESAGISDEEALKKTKKEYDSLSFELEKLESKQEGILREKSYPVLIEEKNNIAKQIAVSEAQISDEEKTQAPSSKIQRSLEIDITTLKTKEAQVRKEVDVTRSASTSQYSHEDLVVIEEEIEQKQEQYKKANNVSQMYQLLLDSLALARKQTMEVSRKHIEKYMQTYLGIVTEGRYNKVTVLDDLSLEVFSSEKNGMLSPETHLSRGTIDQFYLVSRLAVLDLLNKGVKSLLLLDDPFVSFDAHRKEKMKEILMDLRDKFQIILFTHSSEYDEWGDVVNL